MYVLGLAAQYHDAACALIKDGQVVAAVEEERLNRIKHWGGFPELSIRYCLEEAGIGIGDVSHVAYYFNPERRLSNVVLGSIANTKTWFGVKKSAGFIRRSYEQYLRAKETRDLIEKLGFKGRFHFVQHHLSHAASSYLVSPFEEAAVLTVDATGEKESTLMARGIGNKLEVLSSVNQPNSMGYLYAAVTNYLGFQRNSDEYKVMGLASYGKPVYLDKFRDIVTLTPDGKFRFNQDYFVPPSPPAEPKKLSKKFLKAFGPAREKNGPIEDRHADIAASLQCLLEETLVHVANHLHKVTGSDNLCMAGGVALNVVANGRVMERTKFKNIYIQPAAHDPGCAIGSAAYVYHHMLGNPRTHVLSNPYLGPGFTSEEIEAALRDAGVPYQREEDICGKVASLIAEGNIIGWYQGRMEWGPRALGNRSILADARNPDMKDIVNRRIKQREGFRPFAPAVLRECVGEFFEYEGDSPFMLMVVRARADRKHEIPSVVHVDGTARIQTVEKDTNPRFYDLISKFKDITGVPVVLNTSFNIAGEPIVCSPADAIRSLFTADLDYLAAGDFLVRKSAR